MEGRQHGILTFQRCAPLDAITTPVTAYVDHHPNCTTSLDDDLQSQSPSHGYSSAAGRPPSWHTYVRTYAAHSPYITHRPCTSVSSPTRLPPSVGGYLEEEVERHPGEDSVGEELDDAEESEDDPIRKPLCVVLLVLGVNGLAPVDRNRTGADDRALCSALPMHTTRAHVPNCKSAQHTYVRGIGWVHKADKVHNERCAPSNHDVQDKEGH